MASGISGACSPVTASPASQSRSAGAAPSPCSRASRRSRVRPRACFFASSGTDLYEPERPAWLEICGRLRALATPSLVHVHHGSGREAIEVRAARRGVRADVRRVDELAKIEVGQLLGKANGVKRVAR